MPLSEKKVILRKNQSWTNVLKNLPINPDAIGVSSLTDDGTFEDSVLLVCRMWSAGSDEAKQTICVVTFQNWKLILNFNKFFLVTSLFIISRL